MIPKRSVFGEKLRAELDNQGVSIRGLARKMSPEQPEVMRRNLARWIGGYNSPSRIHRVAVADALGVPREKFTDTDDEEEDLVVSLVAAIRRVVRQELARDETQA